ncbi:hypothetical protein A3849_11270 [Paenibacillus sp. P46E]|nr:hypothetical protein A3849_11270 [Paenibacillus sp. P46E]
MALKKDGSVGVWGGTSTDFRTVSGLSGAQAISGGIRNHVILTDGSVWSWINGSPIKETGISEVNAIVTGRYHIVVTKTDGSAWAWGSDNSEGQLGDGTTVAHSTPALVKENTAPKVTLTYPLGSEEAPEEIIIGKPLIKWSQNDAALTLFTAYQVQILNETGDVVEDSGELVQNSTSATGSWLVINSLPEYEPLRVQVRVKDQQVWSEWSEKKWFVIYNALGAKLNNNLSLEKFSVVAGERATVRVSVYDNVYAVDSNILNGTLKVKISGYTVASAGSSGQFGDKELSTDGETIVNVLFTNGVAEVPLILNVPGKQKIYYEVLDIVDSMKKLEIYVIPSEVQKQTLNTEISFLYLKEQLSKPIPIIVVENLNHRYKNMKFWL